MVQARTRGLRCQLPDGRLHGVFTRTRRQPQGQVVHAPVTGQAHKILFVHGDSAKLPGVVAPHPGHKKPRRTGLGKTVGHRFKKVTRISLVARHHGLTDINTDRAGRHAEGRADQWQHPRWRLHVARDQGDRRLVRGQQELRHAQAPCTRHPRHCGHGLHKLRAEIGRLPGRAAGGGAHIQISRQHHIQPVCD